MVASLILLAAVQSAEPVGLLECRKTTRSVEAGEVIDAENTARASCSGDRRSFKLRFDRSSGVVRAREALADGEGLGRLLVGHKSDVLPGDRVQVTARLGKAEISRMVTALQPARAGERFFARSDEGGILVAPPFQGEAQ